MKTSRGDALHVRRGLELRRWDLVVGRMLDAVLETGVASFAWWTVLYHLALVLDAAPSVMAVWWVLGTVAITVFRARTAGRRATIPGRAPNTAAAAVALGTAVLASVVIRPDLDDASYLVRSTWVAERDAVGAGDVIFSDGTWPALSSQDPYLPSLETLFGALARVTGTSAGSVVYLAFVPLAAFGATWALWMLLRAWRLKAPLLGLLLAVAFLLTGGAVHASWGNLSYARIWQGKVVMLAVLVPATYAWAAAYWRSTPGARRTRAAALVASAGVAAVGLSPAGVFVLPEVVVVAALAGIVTGRVRRAVTLVALGAAYPVAAGIVTLLSDNIASSLDTPVGVASPWERTLGAGWPAFVVGAAALMCLVGAVRPRCSGSDSPVARWTAAAAVLAGAVIGLPPVVETLAGIMGTDAITWRTVWVVPVPALVALLAGISVPSPVVGRVTAALAACALVLGGLPIWSPANGASITSRPQWKMYEADVRTGRWIVAHLQHGRYLAPAGVVAAVGTDTADAAPVGSRVDYLLEYGGQPGIEGRIALQQWVDEPTGALQPTDLAGLLDVYDVTVVCAQGDRSGALGALWGTGAAVGAHMCWVRS